MVKTAKGVGCFFESCNEPALAEFSCSWCYNIKYCSKVTCSVKNVLFSHALQMHQGLGWVKHKTDCRPFMGYNKIGANAVVSHIKSIRCEDFPCDVKRTVFAEEEKTGLIHPREKKSKLLISRSSMKMRRDSGMLFRKK